MTQIPVSVVVVSRDRPTDLTLCLTGISQLQHPCFEVIVVADPSGLTAAAALPFAADLRLVPFDERNISAARNLGIAHAAGGIVAFIDDDAVPEPSWLFHLTSPFERPDVAAAGGFVRGRNGISFQWQAQLLDAQGMTRPVETDPRHPTVLAASPGQSVKTEGTNMAIRRDVLLDLGGFDEAFHYFLDETDLNMRLAQAGHATAIVPLAQVHHRSSPNRARGAMKVPRDLFDIGASWAVFGRKHLPEALQGAHRDGIRQGERRRLLRHMVSGRLEPGDVARQMQRFDQGHSEGLVRPMGNVRIAARSKGVFTPFPARPRPGRLLQGRIWSAGRIRAEAAQAASLGEIVTVILLSPTALYHRVAFEAEGYWLQRGGIFGRSDRTQRLFSWNSFASRVRLECDRVRETRML